MASREKPFARAAISGITAGSFTALETVMPAPLVHLDALPSAADFYALYWNRRPFVVRRAIDQSILDDLITPDELAGLAMEETARSRLVALKDWTCRFGPFTEEDFSAAGTSPWSLLVQNVEQFHPATAQVLRAFNFAPRWLMDDIMASFSTQGGTIGGHIDSYHVFLVQGQGKRQWTLGREPILQEEYIDGLDLKILKDDIDGDTVEVSCGDVLYIPPRFAHEGTTLDDALTFSVGFLGPKVSELYGAYGQYLSEHDALDPLYVGDDLTSDSAGFTLSADAVDDFRDRLGRPLNAPAFSQWLTAFFTNSTNDEFGQYIERDDPLTATPFANALAAGATLIKPAYVKVALTASPNGGFCLGFDRQTFDIDDSALPVILSLMKENSISAADTPALLDHLDILRTLYNHQALEFDEPAG